MNDDPHTQMAYPSGEGLKQEYEQGQQAQGQGQAEAKPEYPSHAYSMPTASSPPTSASPFAFAPPPLSSLPGPGSSSRPPLMHSHHYSDGPYPKAHLSQQQPFPGGHPLPAYRRPVVPGPSPSPNMTGQPGSPRAAARQSSLNSNLSNGSNPNLVPSPSGSSPYPSHYFPPQHQRPAVSGSHGSPYNHSPTMSHMGPPPGAPGPYGQMYRQPLYSPQDSPYSYAPSPSYVDHPGMQSRAPYSYLGSPSSYGQHGGPQPPHLLPSISAPSNLGGHGYGSHLPSLSRHSSSSMLPDAMSNVDLASSPGVSGRPPLLQTSSQPGTIASNYSFSRLPLVDRPFKCDECVQSFNRNHDLKRHKRIHLSVKPFGCDKCGKTFSRKDALRRHWLVKGCRGEDGATAKISPTFPLNGPPPALTPPTPEAYSSYPLGGRAPASFAHPGAPPPLPTLPPRQPSDQSTTILTPDDPVGQDGQSIQALQEPVVMSSRSNSDMGNSAPGEEGEGYFDNAIVPKDGMRSAYYPSSPSQKLRGHPYSRSPRLDARYPAGSSAQSSPASGGRYIGQTLQQQQQQQPAFVVPFNAPGQYVNDGAGLMVPGPQGEDMARQPSGTSSQGDDPSYYPRWHRPSFPFPPPTNGNFNEAPTEFVEPAIA